MDALLKTINFALYIFLLILMASVIFSWLYSFNIVNRQSQFIRMIGHFLYQTTEPVLRPIRRILPDTGSIDFSPLVVFLIIYFLQNLIMSARISLLFGG